MQETGTMTRLQLILVACVATVQTALAAAASDLDREVVFNLPEQPLENALLGFSEQAKIQVMTASPNIADQVSSRVVGRQRVRSALDHLLKGTGLGYSVVNETTIAIHGLHSTASVSNWNSPGTIQHLAMLTAAEAPAAQSESSGTSAPATASSTPRENESTGVEEVLVTANKRGAESAQSLPVS